MSNRKKSSNKHSPQAKRGISGSSSHRRGNDRTPALTSGVQNSYMALAVCGFLLLAVVLVFGQTLRHDFVNYDDGDYVYNNPRVAHGFSARGIAWAFASSHAANWHPLTWLSHMLDCQLYGLKPGGHHLTNVLLHAATAILLFLVFRRMTGDLWPSAFVAAVFAIHPLRVESVAWVAERKDVLSGLFFMLTLWIYVGYVRHPFSLVRYLMVMVFFALGLMAKPMLVTLPFVLLLLDYWPLGRMAPNAAKNQSNFGNLHSSRFSILLRLAMEKVPLMVLAAASCMATLWAQSKGVVVIEHIPFSFRIGNAAVSYVAYLGQMFYPAGLAVLYPHPGMSLPMWKVVGALLVLAAICGGVVALWRRCPYLFVGWLWYMGMLLPVIGLIQVGLHAIADRYTYLTQIGLYIAFAWGVAQATRSWPNRGWACGVASALVLAILMGCAWRQTSYWYDGKTLWTRTLACTSQNFLAHNNLANALLKMGQLQEAIEHYQQALRITPKYAEVQDNLGLALLQAGRPEEAIEHFRQFLELKPDYVEAHYDLGLALAEAGRRQEAIDHYEQALRLKTDYFYAHNKLGLALVQTGRPKEAVEHFKQALMLKPDYLEALYNLDQVLTEAGRPQEAIEYYEQALALNPYLPDVHVYLGVALLRINRPEKAIEHFQQALVLKPDFVEACFNLATTYATLHKSSQAVAAAQKAIELARSQQQADLVKQIEDWLNSYRSSMSNPPNISPSSNPAPPLP